MITPGHYAAHAYEGIVNFAKTANREDTITLGYMAQALKEAPKFSIHLDELYPQVFRNTDWLPPKAFRLPYPTVVIESPCRHEARSNKVSTWEEPNKQYDIQIDKTIAIATMIDDSIVINGVTHAIIPDYGWLWIPLWSVSRLRLSDDPEILTRKDFPGLIVSVAPVLGRSRGTINDMMHDILAETQMTLCLLWALDQRRAVIERYAAPKFINKKRIARGACPFDEYHVLTILPPGDTHVASGETPSDRLSPREHERRGHWRHFKSGARTWVRQSKVNEGIGGAIWKDYNVKELYL